MVPFRVIECGFGFIDRMLPPRPLFRLRDFFLLPHSFALTFFFLIPEAASRALLSSILLDDGVFGFLGGSSNLERGAVAGRLVGK
jgi:hypothetical protein